MAAHGLSNTVRGHPSGLLSRLLQYVDLPDTNGKNDAQRELSRVHQKDYEDPAIEGLFQCEGYLLRMLISKTTQIISGRFVVRGRR